MQQIVLNHQRIRVQASAEVKNHEQAIMISAPDFGFELSRERAEALVVMLNSALDATGPRCKTLIDLTGPDAPVFLRRQAD
jgi:hypothetical protein